MIMIGKKFGKLTVRRIADNTHFKLQTRGRAWVCDCDCGNLRIMTSTDLRTMPVNGLTCGCNRANFLFPKGKFGKLTVVARTLNINAVNRHGIKTKVAHTAYYCKCDCGASHVALAQQLKSDKNQSCGCHVTYKQKAQSFYGMPKCCPI